MACALSPGRFAGITFMFLKLFEQKLWPTWLRLFEINDIIKLSLAPLLSLMCEVEFLIDVCVLKGQYAECL